MKIRVSVRLSLIVCIAALGLFASGRGALTASALPAAAEPPSGSPALTFIQNVGQFPEGALFQARGGSGALWLTQDALWVTVLEQSEGAAQEFAALGREPLAAPPNQKPARGVNLRLRFLGANSAAVLEPFDPLEVSINYFIGSDPAQWRTNAPVYAGVRYRELYPGVDLALGAGVEAGLTWRLEARKGADLSRIRLQVDGAANVELRPDTLLVSTEAGDFSLPLLELDGAASASRRSPQVQRIEALSEGGSGFEVSAPYLRRAQPAKAQTQASFDLGYATLLGGSSAEYGGGIAVDASGAAYVTGTTESIDFPTTTGAFDTTHNGDQDAFVAKLLPNGSDLSYAAYLGGSEWETVSDIAVDGDGAAYVIGSTYSDNFPTTDDAVFPSYNDDQDAFVVKIAPDGGSLEYAAYLGGSGMDLGGGIAVDASGAAFVTGLTNSANFPSTPGAYDPSYNDNGDAFVIKIAPDGKTLDYATFLGDDSLDAGYGIVVDAGGSAYVSGFTGSSNFPTTPGAFSASFNGGFTDAFVAKLNPQGSDLSYATFLGGSDIDAGAGIALDPSGAAYVTGRTSSDNFPVTFGAYDTNFNGIVDAFVAKFLPDGSNPSYATYLGGNGFDAGLRIAVDASGAAYVTGNTESEDFPVTPGAFAPAYNGEGDAFMVKLNPNGLSLSCASFLGGSDFDQGAGIALDQSEAVYVTGNTKSEDFPVTPGAFSVALNGDYDAFVVKFKQINYPIYLPIISKTP